MFITALLTVTPTWSQRRCLTPEGREIKPCDTCVTGTYSVIKKDYIVPLIGKRTEQEITVFRKINQALANKYHVSLHIQDLVFKWGRGESRKGTMGVGGGE